MSQEYKILLVEDDLFIRETLAEILDLEGFPCRQAEDGEAARQILEAGEVFDLMISDFRMPRMNGVELLRWCRQHKRHMPVIFITANRELFPKEELALEDCCAALLRKPISIEDLLREIEAARSRSHQWDCGDGS